MRGVTAASEVPFELEVAAVTDVGTEREHNEDRCGFLLENESCGLLVVADGVSSAEAGETASQTAVAATLRTFGEQPAGMSTAKRLYRAVQQANIEIYDLATVVPELRGMTTTLTAVVVDRGELTAAHIGDSRLYLVRGGRIVQLTKDHTVAAERARIGLLSKSRARTHKDRSVLTRSLGRELIVPIDRFSNRLFRGDALLVCSDGLYNALDDEELARLLEGGDAATTCRRLIDTANQRGTLDNLTAAVLRVRRGPEPPAASAGLGARLRGLFGRRGG